MAVGPDGGFLTVWETDDGSSRGIAAQAFDNVGSPIGGELLVNTSTTYHQTRPSVTADQSGRFIVVWTDSTSTYPDGFEGVIRGRILQPGSASGVSEPTSTMTEGSETPAPGSIAQCPGDCNSDDLVDVAELVANVRIVFGEAPVCTCDRFSLDDDGELTVVDLLRAVDSALDGCPPRP